MSHKVTLREVVQNKEKPLCSIFFTAGYPELVSTTEVYLALQEAGVDFVEIGFPFSDPIADGSTIQKTSERAIKNGMNLEVLFRQLREIRDQMKMPVILMGYLNPIVRYGVRRFIRDCAETGISGLILPDLPLYEYDTEWKQALLEAGISLIFLVTPQTTEERIREIDSRSTSFIYAVSSQAVTGGTASSSRELQEAYFSRLSGMNLLHPVVVGFGIHDKESFDFACRHLQGAIIGSEFLRVIGDSEDIKKDVVSFIRGLRG